MAIRYLQSAQSTSTLVVYDAASGGSISSLSDGDTLELNTYALTIDSATWPVGATITIQNTAGGTITVSMASAARTVNAILRAVAASTTLCTATGHASNRLTIAGLYGGANTGAVAMLINTNGALLTVNGEVAGGNGTGTTSYGLSFGGANTQSAIINGAVTSYTSPAINTANPCTTTVNTGPITSGSIYAIGGGQGHTSSLYLNMVSGTSGWVQATRGPAPFAIGNVYLTLDGNNVYWSSDGSQFSLLATAAQMAQVRSRLGLDGVQTTPTCPTSTLSLASTQNYYNHGTSNVYLAGQDRIDLTTILNQSNKIGTLSLVLGTTEVAASIAPGKILGPQTFDLHGTLSTVTTLTNAPASVTVAQILAATSSDYTGALSAALGDAQYTATQVTTDHGSGSYVASGTAPTADENAAAAWNYSTRTLTAGGSSGASAADVWSYGTRTLSTAGTDSIVAALGGYAITLASPVTEDEDLELVQGDDYTHSLRQPTWTVSSYTGPSLTSATATLSLCGKSAYDAETDTPLLTVNGSITVVDSTVTIKVPITAAQTAALPTYPSDDPYHLMYQLRTTDGTNLQTLALGAATVKRKVIS